MREHLLPSWEVLDRSQKLRGWTAWNDKGAVVTFRWTLELTTRTDQDGDESP